MPSRRSHTKSHHGCTQCKSRRIKCDENLPECNRCVRRQTQCSFLEHSQDARPISALVSVMSTPTQPSPQELLPRPPDLLQNVPIPTSLQEAGPPIPVPLPSNTFGLLELELLHHYTTQTYMTLTSRLKSHIIWRDVIFREALRHSFLLDAIMATAALHKASYVPAMSDAHTEYSRRALAYENASLAGYIRALNDPTKDNSIALFAISIFLPVWCFGSKQLPEGLSNGSLGISPNLRMRRSSNDSSPTDDTVDFSSVISLMQVIQGISAVIMQTREWLVEELMELLLTPTDDELPANSPDVDAALTLLAHRIELDCSSVTNKSEATKEIHQLYLERLQSLRQVARCRTLLEWDPYIFSWPVTVKPLYMDLLRQHDPIALALFIHWAACYRALDHLWWAKGWAFSLVRDLCAMLDDSWNEIMIWPRQAVGLSYQSPGSRLKLES